MGRKALRAASSDLDDLGLGLRDLYRVADRFAEQGARQRRGVRHRAVRGIGFVLADDAESLTPAIVAHDGYGCAEMHLAAIAWGRDASCALALRAVQ